MRSTPVRPVFGSTAFQRTTDSSSKQQRRNPLRHDDGPLRMEETTASLEVCRPGMAPSTEAQLLGGTRETKEGEKKQRQICVLDRSLLAFFHFFCLGSVVLIESHESAASRAFDMSSIFRWDFCASKLIGTPCSRRAGFR